jgi:sRNA-binding carbon storage regulator CsrA
VKIGIEAPDYIRIKRGEIATVSDEAVDADDDLDLLESLNGSMYAAMLVQL